MKIFFPLTVILFLLATTMVPPFARSQPADSCKVWFTPNMGSTDMLQLFTNPTQWDSARSKVDVFKFFSQQLNTWPCMGGLCNANTISNLAQVQAFTKLNKWGIDIAIEGAGILPLTLFGTPVDCSLEKQNAVQDAFNWTVDAIINVQSHGGTVRYIAIDEPIRRWYSKLHPALGGPECKTDNLAEIAAMVADFINMMQNAAPFIKVGQIILYPEINIDEIKMYVTELENLGISLPFLHLDVHGLRIIEYSGTTYGMVTLNQVKTDLQDLESFFHARNIAFAPILIDLMFTTQVYQFGQYTDKTYYDGAIDWINQVKSAIGIPDHQLFQSWAWPSYTDTSLISLVTPINLPENDPVIYSHTRLINEGLDILNSPPTSVSDPPTGLPEKFALQQNYPNPFNPQTTIQYQLANDGIVTLSIFSLLGQEVRTLVNENQTAGSYSIVWDGKNDRGEMVTSGMYFYKLKIDKSFVATRKMLFLK